jgi:hypothetical protein
MGMGAGLLPGRLHRSAHGRFGENQSGLRSPSHSWRFLGRRSSAHPLSRPKVAGLRCQGQHLRFSCRKDACSLISFPPLFGERTSGAVGSDPSSFIALEWRACNIAPRLLFDGSRLASSRASWSARSRAVSSAHRSLCDLVFGHGSLAIAQMIDALRCYALGRFSVFEARKPCVVASFSHM